MAQIKEGRKTTPPYTKMDPHKKWTLIDHEILLGPGKYYTLLFKQINLKKMGPLQFCLLALLEIHRHPMQKDFLKSCEGFMSDALTVHGHPGPA